MNTNVICKMFGEVYIHLSTFYFIVTLYLIDRYRVVTSNVIIKVNSFTKAKQIFCT